MTDTDRNDLLKGLSQQQKDIEVLLERASRWDDAERPSVTSVIKKMRDLNKLATYPAPSQVPESREPTAKEWESLNPLFNKVEKK